jgi:hypothetical protein
MASGQVLRCRQRSGRRARFSGLPNQTGNQLLSHSSLDDVFVFLLKKK